MHTHRVHKWPPRARFAVKRASTPPLFASFRGICSVFACVFVWSSSVSDRLFVDLTGVGACWWLPVLVDTPCVPVDAPCACRYKPMPLLASAQHCLLVLSNASACSRIHLRTSHPSVLAVLSVQAAASDRAPLHSLPSVQFATASRLTAIAISACRCADALNSAVRPAYWLEHSPLVLSVQ